MFQTLRWLLGTRYGRRMLRKSVLSILTPQHRWRRSPSDTPRRIDASLLQAQLDRIAVEGTTLVQRRGEPQGAEPGPVIAYLEAFHIGHIIGGVKSFSRDLYWSRLPVYQHLQLEDYILREEDELVRRIEQLVLHQHDVTMWDLARWAEWMLRTQNQIKPTQRGNDIEHWHFRGHPIRWGLGAEEVTGPDPDTVIDLLEQVFAAMAQVVSPFVRGAILEYGLQTVQPWPGWHNAAHILAANLVTYGRSIPSAVTVYEETEARLDILWDGPAQPWLELRYDRHMASGRVPTHDTIAAIESWALDSYDYDPIMGGARAVAEHAQQFVAEANRSFQQHEAT